MLNGKILVHLRAPVLTQSGYGAHAREVLDYLLADDKYLVALESINWGNCGYINKTNFANPEQLSKYHQCIAVWDQVKGKHEFDIAIHVSIPNEFQRTAKVCIGVTAGIEVDRVSREWIHKCNEMDLVVVPSEHSARTLQGTVYQVKDNKTGETVDERVSTPVFIINEYFGDNKDVTPLDMKFSTEKNLLCVGLWGGKGSFGEDRKNIANLVKFFIEEFKDDPKMGLILKTQLVNGSAKDRLETTKRLRDIKNNFGDDVKCKINLIHKELTDKEMVGLYLHPQVTGMVSLAAGEGFGRPILEAASCGLPVIATNWSGHLDFLRKGSGFIPLKYELVQIPECQVWENILIKESRWAKVDEKDAKKRMRKFLESPRKIQKEAKGHVSWLEANFSKKAAWSKWDKFFGQFIKDESERPQAASDVKPEHVEHLSKKAHAVKMLEELVDLESDKEKVLYVIPQSAGDCLISTSIIYSLIANRHWDTDFDFYVATSPQFRPLFQKLVDDFGVKLIDYDHGLMFQSELTKEVWDHVYCPGINVQFTFSNWLNGNGDHAVRLLEEFAKACNLHPQEIKKYQVEIKPCEIPETAYVVIAPGGQKSAKTYKYWPDVIENLKKMSPGIEVVQVGANNEDLLDGVLDYRGKEYSESFHIIQNAAMLIGVDSFPAHAAAAMETPHLAIYASTHATTCSPLLFKKNIPQISIEETERCNPRCYKDVCMKEKDGKNCLSNINASTICHGIMSILKKVSESENKDELAI